MIELTIEDYRALVNLLRDLPELANEQSRRLVLEQAGLKQLIPMIDFSGSSFIATSQIVSYLANYGRLTFDHETLGLLLNLIKNFVGIQQKDFIDMLLIKYNMMVPVVLLPSIGQWEGKETSTDVLEKIIGENTLRPIAFLAQGLQVSRSVAYIEVHTNAQYWSGTGFLITPDLLLTNYHVIASTNVVPYALFRFNYEENFRGEAQKHYEYRARSNGIFHTSDELDYTVIQLEGEAGKEWGWLPLRPREIRRRDRVNIIQHPNGQPKQISFQNNFVEYVGGHVVQYVTSTLNGSSGSPVLNDGWEVVALHHAGVNIREPMTQHHYFRNEGILIGSILTDLPSALREQLLAAVVA